MTGGGTGLGLVTAQTLAQNGCKVYVTGRRAEVLDKAAEFKPSRGDGKIIAIQADLNSKEAILGKLHSSSLRADRSELRKKIKTQEKYINILVNSERRERLFQLQIPNSRPWRVLDGRSPVQDPANSAEPLRCRVREGDLRVLVT